MIPNLPQPTSKTITEEMMFTDIWYLFFSQLIIALQKQLSTNGLGFPEANTATIASLNNPSTLNTMIKNSDTNELLVNLTGTYQVVQVV